MRDPTARTDTYIYSRTDDNRNAITAANEWLCGAIALANVFDPDIPGAMGRLGSHHVFLRKDDEGELLEALEPLPVRYKKLSPMEARKAIPDVDSLFQVSSESGCVAGQATSSVDHTLSA